MAAKTIDELFEEFDLAGFRKEYADFQRRDPFMAGKVAEMIRAGIKPFKIAERYFEVNPHRWLESKAILSAARYLEAQLDQ